MKKTRPIIIFFLSVYAATLSPQALAFPSTTRTHALRAPRTSLSSSVRTEDSFREIAKKLAVELKEISECSGILYGYASRPERGVTVKDVVEACDKVDECADAGEYYFLPGIGLTA